MPPANSQSLENMDVIQKANMTLADLTTAGKLTTEQAKEFIKIAIIGSKLLGMVTVQPMNAPQREINKIRFESRILGPGKSGAAVTAAGTVKPTTSKVTLSTVIAKGTVRIEDEVFEDNVERDSLRQTVMGLIGEKCGADMEELTILGDTTSTDPFLALLDGFIKQTVSNAVAAGGVSLSKTVLRDLFKALPREFRRDKSKLAFLTSSDAQVDYVDSLASRATPGGDSALESGRDEPTWSKVPVVDIPLFPNTLGGGNDETVVLLTDPKNLTVGVQRDIRLEYVRDVEAGENVFVVTLRLDAKLAHEKACAIATGVTN